MALGITWGVLLGDLNLLSFFFNLRKDEDKYFLVTPAEKVGIKVDDAPFVESIFLLLVMARTKH